MNSGQRIIPSERNFGITINYESLLYYRQRELSIITSWIEDQIPISEREEFSCNIVDDLFHFDVLNRRSCIVIFISGDKLRISDSKIEVIECLSPNDVPTITRRKEFNELLNYMSTNLHVNFEFVEGKLVFKESSNENSKLLQAKEDEELEARILINNRSTEVWKILKCFQGQKRKHEMAHPEMGYLHITNPFWRNLTMTPFSLIFAVFTNSIPSRKLLEILQIGKRRQLKNGILVPLLLGEKLTCINPEFRDSCIISEPATTHMREATGHSLRNLNINRTERSLLPGRLIATNPQQIEKLGQCPDDKEGKTVSGLYFGKHILNLLRDICRVEFRNIMNWTTFSKRVHAQLSKNKNVELTLKTRMELNIILSSASKIYRQLSSIEGFLCPQGTQQEENRQQLRNISDLVCSIDLKFCTNLKEASYWHFPFKCMCGYTNINGKCVVFERYSTYGKICPILSGNPPIKRYLNENKWLKPHFNLKEFSIRFNEYVHFHFNHEKTLLSNDDIMKLQENSVNLTAKLYYKDRSFFDKDDIGNYAALLAQLVEERINIEEDAPISDKRANSNFLILEIIACLFTDMLQYAQKFKIPLTESEDLRVGTAVLIRTFTNPQLGLYRELRRHGNVDCVLTRFNKFLNYAPNQETICESPPDSFLERLRLEAIIHPEFFKISLRKFIELCQKKMTCGQKRKAISRIPL